MNLETKFPQFQFAAYADEFLMNCHSNNLARQIKLRQIASVAPGALLSQAGIGIDEYGKFFITINDTLTCDEMAFALGHEIGHTFHYDLHSIPPKNILPENLRDEVEAFCNDFSICWVKRVGLFQLVNRFKNELKLITHHLI